MMEFSNSQVREGANRDLYRQNYDRIFGKKKTRRTYTGEDDLNAGVEVIWKGEKYTTGNRYHDLVELYRDGKLVEWVAIVEVYSEENPECPSK